ncbi:hypothetical protein I4641_12130 [Waterburya agarophytonicola K14]|uniref:Uncharacterized protein n=1 Tax=Waterburya agarophytonicola KI4 TaxID=2874699 RepID=A0A964BSK2_9CYAN|nr:hypothetical protein [Waterburya agarophytonicola]MCC0177728.1 hypothetical protein [Waterburya agarophytonicola KI4]
MVEIDEWVQQNKLHIFAKKLVRKEQSDLELSKIIEDVKTTELELWEILQSNLAQSEKDQEIL